MNEITMICKCGETMEEIKTSDGTYYKCKSCGEIQSSN